MKTLCKNELTKIYGGVNGIEYNLILNLISGKVLATQGTDTVTGEIVFQTSNYEGLLGAAVDSPVIYSTALGT